MQPGTFPGEPPIRTEEPLTITLRCSCGQVYHADPAHAGRGIRCRCGRTLTVPIPEADPRPRRSKARTGGRTRFRMTRLAVPPWVRKALTLLTGLFLAGSLAYAGLLWLEGDRWWLATVLLYLPRWPLLLPAPLLALGALAIRPRLLLPIVAGAIVALGPAMGYRIGWRRWFAGSHADLRIVTFNVESWVNPQLAMIPFTLARLDPLPDIIALQECNEALADPERWPAGWTVRYDEANICLMTRFPLIEARTLERVSTGEQGEAGNAMFYRLRNDSSGSPVDLAVVHLETARKGMERLRYEHDLGGMELGILVRDAGSSRVSRWIAAQSQNALIAGDFNLPVESAIYRDRWGRCANAFSRVGRGFGWTRVLQQFSIRIDHVLTCDSWRAVRATVGPDLGSDHLPLIVDVARVR